MNRLIGAEWRVLMKRGSARGMLLISALIPALVTVILGFASSSDIAFNGQPIGETVSFSGPHAAALSLRARHAIFLPMFILFVTGTSFASERGNQMLRERLVRPVSRDSMLVAKFFSILFLCSLSLLINLVVAILIGTPWMGTEGPWSSMLLGHALSVCTDIGLISLGLLLSTVFRTGAMVVVSGLLIFVTDQGISAGLFMLGIFGVQTTSSVPMFLPSTGWNVWSAMMGEQSWLAGINLLAWTLCLLFFARYRLLRMDIP